MARPTKTGLNYFPLDVDFFDDPRVGAVTVEHGTKGQAAVVMLLCAIYRNGYYIEWTQENCIAILKELPGINIKKMQKIVRTLVEWDFFDRSLFEGQQVLTSRDIQQHYTVAARKRKVKPDETMPYWMGDEAPTPPAKATPSRAEGELRTAETGKRTAEMTQEDNIKIYINPSPSTTRAREDDIQEEKGETVTVTEPARKWLPQETPRGELGIREAVDQMRDNEAWMEVMCMKHHLDKGQLEQLIGEFATDCECRGKTVHDNISDAQGHFCNWLLIRQKQSSQQQAQSLKPNYHGNNYQQRTSADYIREAQQWAIERSLQTIRAPKNGDTEIQGIFPL
jgi:hypothetical protein